MYGNCNDYSLKAYVELTLGKYSELSISTISSYGFCNTENTW